MTERLERRLQQVPHLKTLRSYTNPGLSVIFIDLEGSARGRDVSDAWYEVRKKAGDIRHTLPQGVQGPFFNDEFGDTFGIIYGFTTDGFSRYQLRDTVESIRSRLLRVPDVSKIEILGAQDERIFVEFSFATLSQLGVSPDQLVAALAAQNLVRPAGMIRTGEEAIALRVSGAFTSEQDILDVNFMVEGRLLRLRDIATVPRGYADPPQPFFRLNGREALGLAIVFPPMEPANIALQRISLGALIIALALLVDDAMTTIDAMTRRLAAGDPMEKPAVFTYETLAFAMLAGTFITIAGFVPIGFAQFEYDREYPQVWRRNREPTLTVAADVAPGVLPDTVIAELAAPMRELNERLPEGYRIELGGIAEESAESQASVFAVVPLMLVIVLTVLIFQLRSFQRMAIVLSVVPLGLIGVVGALLLSGQPLGFVAILGVLALVGMIAKNAVILIDRIEAERRDGKPVRETVIDASASRLRPILLTALSTVLGLLPIAFTVFWGAMAFAIMGGLLVASLLTLVFLPTVYATWFGRTERRQPATG